MRLRALPVLGAALLSCTATQNDLASSSAAPPASDAPRVGIAEISDPGCRAGSADTPDRGTPTREVVLPLSLAPFGAPPSPAATRAVAAWAVAPATLGSSCRTVGTSEPHVGFYRGGGFSQSFCSWALGGREIRDEQGLAAALAPVDSPRKALALVALAQPIAFEAELAAPRPERRVQMPAAIADKGILAFDVAAFRGGYVVRVPQELSCPRSVYRRAWRVTTEGALCSANEPSILLDAGDGVCAD